MRLLRREGRRTFAVVQASGEGEAADVTRKIYEKMYEPGRAKADPPLSVVARVDRAVARACARGRAVSQMVLHPDGQRGLDVLMGVEIVRDHEMERGMLRLRDEWGFVGDVAFGRLLTNGEIEIFS